MISENKLKNISLIIVVFISVLTFNSCKAKKEQVKKDETTKYQNHQKATVTKNELDGCTWIIVTEEGKKLEPVNLSDEFKVDQLPVWIQYKNYTGNSICMMGQMVTVTAIAKR